MLTDFGDMNINGFIRWISEALNKIFIHYCEVRCWVNGVQNLLKERSKRRWLLNILAIYFRSLTIKFAYIYIILSISKYHLYILTKNDLFCSSGVLIILVFILMYRWVYCVCMDFFKGSESLKMIN